MNLRLGIILEVFKGVRQIYIQIKAWVLPFSNNILILNKYLKEPPCVLQLARGLSVDNTIQREDQQINMNLRLGIILEVFKGGRQIYIQMKA